MGTARGPGRPRGRTNPLVDSAAAEQYLADKFPDEKKRALLIRLAHAAAPDSRGAGERLKLLAKKTQDAASVLGQGPGDDYIFFDSEYPDEVLPLTAMLCASLQEAAMQAQELEFQARPRGAASLPAQALSLLSQLATVIPELKTWARDYSRQKLSRRDADAVRKYEPRRAFCVRLMAWSARLDLPRPRATELMALAVLVGLEPPGDYERRLDTWRHRYKKAERDLPIYERKTRGHTGS
jgi:hypothetical protein